MGKLLEHKTGLNVPSELLDQLKKNDPYLRELNNWYVNNEWQSIKNLVLYEKYDTPVAPGIAVRVVDETSSNPGIPKIRLVPMDADHLTICKPPARTHEIYITIKDFIETQRDDVRKLRAERLQRLELQKPEVERAADDWNFVIRFPFEEAGRRTS